jgi:proline iminopeptidase
MRTARNLPIFLGLSAGIYAACIRPRLLHWGATQDEVQRPFPGADLIPGGTRSATMATTIDAPPDHVWPWLVQMGTDRAGWYSWDHLDNWGHSSETRIHPEWQEIKVGDRMAAMSDGDVAWEVAALEPERFLGLRMSLDLRGRPFDPTEVPPRFYTDSLWAFLLEELPGNRTRLIVSGYWAFQPRWLQPLMTVLFLDLQHWIMQMRQFANLKHHVEQAKPATRYPSPMVDLAAARIR